MDTGDLDQVKRVIAGIKDEKQQLTGILHCAGMVADSLILKKTSACFSEVLVPKVAGTFNLDQASQDVELDFFVLFSSIAASLGNRGQADYATANGFMDQFAAYRNRQVAAGQRHGRTRSINWPLWQAGGMRVDPSSQELVQQTTGMRTMQTATGVQAFYRSLALPYDQIMVVEGRQPKIAIYLEKARILSPSSRAATAGVQRDGPAVIQAAVSLDQLEQQLGSIVATVLGIKASSIDVDQPFVELGLDSFLRGQPDRRDQQQVRHGAIPHHTLRPSDGQRALAIPGAPDQAVAWPLHRAASCSSRRPACPQPVATPSSPGGCATAGRRQPNGRIRTTGSPLSGCRADILRRITWNSTGTIWSRAGARSWKVPDQRAGMSTGITIRIAPGRIKPIPNGWARWMTSIASIRNSFDLPAGSRLHGSSAPAVPPRELPGVRRCRLCPRYVEQQEDVASISALRPATTCHCCRDMG